MIFDLALQELNQALVNREKNPTTDTLPIKYNLGLTYYLVGRFDKSLDILNDALTLAEEANEQVFKAAIRSGIAGIYFQRGKYSEALNSYEQALEIYEEINSTET